MEHEILKGLPVTGPAPLYFAGPYPAPWREGFVVRFDDPRRGSWVGNFQEGHSWLCAIVDWHEAGTIAVVAHGSCYLLDTDDPAEFVLVQGMATSIALTPDRSLLLVATYSDLIACSPDRSELWRREHLALDGVVVEGFEQGVVFGEYCADPDKPWKPFRIKLKNGSNA